MTPRKHADDKQVELYQIMADKERMTIHTQLTEIKTIVSSLNCAVHGQKMDEIHDTVLLLKDAVMGNGKPGLINKVERHDTYFKMCAGGGALIGALMAGLNVIK